MTLEDLIKLDAAGIAGQDFDEVVTLYPLGAAAAGVSVSVIVIREEPMTLEEGARVHDATILLPVASAPSGYKPSTQDQFDVVLRHGEAAELVRVTHIAAGDPGFWQLEVRR